MNLSVETKVAIAVATSFVVLMVGAMADRMGLHHAFVIPVICYLYILYYGLRGSRPNSERYVKA